MNATKEDPKEVPKDQQNDITNRMDILEAKMERILEKLDKLDSLDKLNNLDKLDNLDKLEEIGNNCNKMGNHIDFVETVYDTLRAPLQYISNKINKQQHALLPSSSNEKERK